MRDLRPLDASSNAEYEFSFPEKLFARPEIISCEPIHTVFCDATTTPMEITTRNWGWLSLKVIDAEGWEFQPQFFCFEENQTTVLAPKGTVLKVRYSNWWGRSKAEVLVPLADSSLPSRVKLPVPALQKALAPVLRLSAYFRGQHVSLPRIEILKSIRPRIVRARIHMLLANRQFRADPSAMIAEVRQALSKVRRIPPPVRRDLICVERKISHVLDYIRNHPTNPALVQQSEEHKS